MNKDPHSLGAIAYSNGEKTPDFSQDEPVEFHKNLRKLYDNLGKYFTSSKSTEKPTKSTEASVLDHLGEFFASLGSNKKITKSTTRPKISTTKAISSTSKQTGSCGDSAVISYIGSSAIS